MTRTTVKTIEKLAAGEKRREIRDSDERGLYIVVQPSGSKSYAFRYTSPISGKSAKLTLGNADTMLLAEARINAAELRRQVMLGNDPAADRKSAAAKPADDPADMSKVIPLFLLDYALDVRASSLALAKHQFAFNIIGKTDRAGELLRDSEGRAVHDGPWRGRKIESITGKDVTLILSQIKERGALIEANRVHALLRRFFNWALEKELIENSPLAGKKRPTKVEPTRDRVLSPDEIRWLWMATEEKAPFNSIVRVLLLTGQRRLEVSEMPFKELDMAAKLWTLPPARTKNKRAHSVPLTDLALEAINAAPSVGKKYVFSINGEAPLNGWSKQKDRIVARMTEFARQEAAAAGLEGDVELEHWTIHDLRRTCASGMARLRQPIHVAEAVLNHASGAVSGIARVYNRHSYGDEKREALEAWSNYIASLVEPQRNVVMIRSIK